MYGERAILIQTWTVNWTLDRPLRAYRATLASWANQRRAYNFHMQKAYGHVMLRTLETFSLPSVVVFLYCIAAYKRIVST